MKRLATFLASSLLGMGLLSTLAPTAFAADNQKAIRVNGKQIASVNGIVVDNTTYMPIWYVMRALTSLGVQNHWDGRKWTITVGKGTPLGLKTSGTAADSIVVNGQTAYRVRGIVSGGTTYMPIWYVIQILNKIGVQNTWDGKSWNITGAEAGSTSGTASNSTNSTSNSTNSTSSSTSSAASTGSTNSASASSASSTTNNSGNTSTLSTTSYTLPNAATDDTAYWNRANNNLYIQASTYSYSSASGPSILSVETGQPLYLVAASSNTNVAANPQWFVNSPDGSISTDPNVVLSIGNYQAGNGTFTATKPGIYTVQAESNGVYSEPLVIIVGLNQLTAPSNLAVNSNVNGIESLPSGVTSYATGTVSGIIYGKYQPVNGWLPVSGTVSGSSSSVEVYLQSSTSSNTDWVYRLPVVNGRFSGMVRIPFTGQVIVTFYQGFNQTLTTQGEISYTDDYVVSNSVSMSETDEALLASAEMDTNMSPVFAQEASILMENAPSKRTGIVAINNFAAEDIEYDMQSYLSNTSIWHDSLSEWNLRLGVCGDIAELAATMMKSIGIPVETIIGSADGGLHEWIRVYNGSAWEILDPTWDAPVHSQSNEPVDVLSNEYNDSSPDFLSTHQQTALGEWQ